MSAQKDFEQSWLAKFSSGLEEVVGEEIRKRVMAGSEGLSSDSSRQAVIDWSRRAMERLDALVDVEGRKRIMTGCACRYPRSSLREIREGAVRVVSEGFVGAGCRDDRGDCEARVGFGGGQAGRYDRGDQDTQERLSGRVYEGDGC